jgi:hypothetical protein
VIVHQTFVDFKKAYDPFRREVFCNILTEFGIPFKLAHEMCAEVHIGNNLSHNFPIQNGPKQGDAFLTLLLNFAVVYTIKKVKVNQVGLKINGTYQLLVYADDMNLLRENIDTLKKNTKNVINTSKEVGLEVNAEKSICCCLVAIMQGKVMT